MFSQMSTHQEGQYDINITRYLFSQPTSEHMHKTIQLKLHFPAHDFPSSEQTQEGGRNNPIVN